MPSYFPLYRFFAEIIETLDLYGTIEISPYYLREALDDPLEKVIKDTGITVQEFGMLLGHRPLTRREQFAEWRRNNSIESRTTVSGSLLLWRKPKGEQDVNPYPENE